MKSAAHYWLLRVICHTKEPLKNTWQLQGVQGCTLVVPNGTSQQMRHISCKLTSEKRKRKTDFFPLSQTNTVRRYVHI